MSSALGDRNGQLLISLSFAMIDAAIIVSPGVHCKAEHLSVSNAAGSMKSGVPKLYSMEDIQLMRQMNCHIGCRLCKNC